MIRKGIGEQLDALHTALHLVDESIDSEFFLSHTIIGLFFRK